MGATINLMLMKCFTYINHLFNAENQYTIFL